jgi:hypothetical protein
MELENTLVDLLEVPQSWLRGTSMLLTITSDAGVCLDCLEVDAEEDAE